MRLATDSRPGNLRRATAYPPRVAMTIVIAVTTSAVIKLLRNQSGKRVSVHRPV